MRPQSIILFERLYLASMAVMVINTWLTSDATIIRIERDPTLIALGWGAGAFLIVAAISLLFSLLQYYLIAYRANTIAKWLLVAFTAIGLLGLPGVFATSSGAALMTAVLASLLGLAAVVLLFQADARAWFAGSHGANTDISAAD